MTRCVQCGRDYPEGQRFCHQCGAQLRPRDAPAAAERSTTRVGSAAAHRRSAARFRRRAASRSSSLLFATLVVLGAGVGLAIVWRQDWMPPLPRVTISMPGPQDQGQPEKAVPAPEPPVAPAPVQTEAPDTTPPAAPAAEEAPAPRPARAPEPSSTVATTPPPSARVPEPAPTVTAPPSKRAPEPANGKVASRPDSPAPAAERTPRSASHRTRARAHDETSQRSGRSWLLPALAGRARDPPRPRWPRDPSAGTAPVGAHRRRRADGPGDATAADRADVSTVARQRRHGKSGLGGSADGGRPRRRHAPGRPAPGDVVPRHLRRDGGAPGRRAGALGQSRARRRATQAGGPPLRPRRRRAPRPPRARRVVPPLPGPSRRPRPRRPSPRHCRRPLSPGGRMANSSGCSPRPPTGAGWSPSRCSASLGWDIDRADQETGVIRTEPRNVTFKDYVVYGRVRATSWTSSSAPSRTARRRSR